MDVVAIIAETFRLPKEHITDDLSYQSITEWSSLNHVSLMLALEKETGIVIHEDLLLKLTSVKAIRNYFPPEESGSGPLESVSVNHNSAAIQEQPAAEGTEALLDKHVVYRGLNDIKFDHTTITHMDGKQGILEYRGYSIHDLAQFSNYEEVAYLLIHKELPAPEQLADFKHQLRLSMSRPLPGPVSALIRSMSEAEPATVLRTAISMLASYDEEQFGHSAEGRQRKGIRLIAQLPVILAQHYRGRRGLPFVEPGSAFSFSGNVLYMLTGEAPSPAQERIVGRNLILHADHSSNASTFAARVVTGTQADIHGAVTAAIAAFSGPLHGGAIEQTMKMLREIGEPELAAEYVRQRRERQEPVMGFGHRVYRTEDPRARHLRQSVLELSEALHERKWIEILDAVVSAMQPYSRHGVHVNVDFYACVIYSMLGLPDELFVSLFIVGRMAGWVAHILEQWENNILIRPVMHYNGEPSRPYPARIPLQVL